MAQTKKLNPEERKAKKAAAAAKAEARNKRLEKEMALHLSGGSFRQIAEQISSAGTPISKSQVEKDINAMLDAMDAKNVSKLERLRTKQYYRYESLFLAYWGAALAGNIKAAYFADKLMHSMNELYGLNAPAKLELSNPDGTGVMEPVAGAVNQFNEQLLKVFGGTGDHPADTDNDR